jgi:hypothetical protein
MLTRCHHPKKTALNRQIRDKIGERLRKHYDLERQTPLPKRFAELAMQFGQPLDDRRRKPISLG